MDQSELASILTKTLEDHRLSTSETRALRERLADLVHVPQMANLTRQLAFELARKEIANSANVKTLNWLEDLVRLLFGMEQDPTTTTPLSQAYFSPGAGCVERIIQCFYNCKITADVCVFTITDDRITRAISDAHQRRVNVRIVTDDEKIQDLGSDIGQLAKAGIGIRHDAVPGHMHHKFAVFDNKLLLTGSYNWTRGAERDNYENFLTTTDPKLIAVFVAEFNRLWTKFG